MTLRPMRLEVYREPPRLIQTGTRPRNLAGWRWRIRATNGRILADSGEAYQRLRDCAHGADLVLQGILTDRDVRPGADYYESDHAADLWRITVQP